MNLINLGIFMMILVAFAIGSGLVDVEREVIIDAFDNATIQVKNISFDKTDNDFANGLLNIIEEGLDFVVVFFSESMKLGIYFGQENPEYFQPDFVFKLIKLIIILLIVSLLIKPLFYILIFLVMAIMWIFGKWKKRKKKSKKQE